ncbi:hypothetical protein B0J13DRAFT_627373 [Dactylonectria estremocensis]|uniref:Nucleoside phosphorylase domain-containing protein n=1 Tax=Dactylonectria estremocensis TaxID=1079267 RepID=A0A9P9IQM2_9HYPO|nr:hypothetical protein B0J13DRAFT_627373 [Dactylonectria estremocensis]
MSFGYSAGDVITGANLTYRLIRIMAETKDALVEYLESMSKLCKGGTGDESAFPGVSKPWNTAQIDHHRQRQVQNIIPRLPPQDYTVGWICALPIELAAATAMLDCIHENLPIDPSDSNTYTLGNMGKHNVVVACLPIGGYGTNNAATVASNMNRSFRSICTRLMVGIGGGVPGKLDVRLGDVVVSKEVVQYDHGKTIQEGHFQRTGTLNKPPQALLTAVSKLEADYASKPSKVPSILSEMLARFPSMTKYTYPGSLYDRLFDGSYDHEQSMDNCENCDASRLVKRIVRSSTHPAIHYGVVASGNQVMKHGMTRDRLAKQLDVLCFEMEAAGLMDSFPCLVIRGICDYSDSHKNKQWQEYAAATAAAYAKELLSILSHSVSIAKGGESDGDRRKQLLDSLGFEEFDSRLLNIQESYSETCHWLLEHPCYLKWLDPAKAVENHGFLWIKGKPGAGKSTLMSFVYKEATKDKKRTVVSFFFNARGGELERSTTGMYRSLLYQLLKAVPGLLSVLDKPNNEDEIDTLRTIVDGGLWKVKMLQDLLRTAISRLDHHHVMLFIDAIDECNVDEVEEIVEHLQTLGACAVSNRSRFNICISSRHYPHIDIEYGQELVLEHEDGHTRDIATYIHSKLKVGKGKTSDEIKDRMRVRAHGVFMWVVLVVSILNKEYRGGRVFAVKKRLDTIPGKLVDLFKEILSRDQENMQDLQLYIQWIFFARQEVTPDDMQKFVTSSSKGLAETTETTSVQFIHESVREFFLKDGLPGLWPNLISEFQSFSHSQLQQCCYTYIKLDVLGPVPSHIPDDNTSLRALRKFEKSVCKRLPFIRYATQNLLYHADLAAHDVPQGAFLKQFDLKAWTKLDNLFKRTYDLNSPTATLVYVLAENNLPNLIEAARHLGERFHARGEYYKYPLFAALCKWNQGAVRALLQQDEYIAKGYGIPHGDGQTPLGWAMRNNDLSLVKLFIMSKEFDINMGDRGDDAPLLWAIKRGHDSVVELLLATKGVDVNVQDHRNQTAIFEAARAQKEAMVLLLLAAGADVKVRDWSGRTPLSWAIEFGSEAIIKLLLSAEGVDIESRDRLGWTPFFWAAVRRRWGIAMLLLRAGANADPEDNHGWTPFSWVAAHNDVAALLAPQGQLDAGM